MATIVSGIPKVSDELVGSKSARKNWDEQSLTMFLSVQKSLGTLATNIRFLITTLLSEHLTRGRGVKETLDLGTNLLSEMQTWFHYCSFVTLETCKCIGWTR
ncbi:hypothetical protein VNO78_02987 [Psophocarpus tetragonolobus]|uniref:Uncharacterized protein n=1 Tax=Psophocarpus tetragonolobus TaxID=3891 RepID=A0AAN9T3H9_PSOTE